MDILLMDTMQQEVLALFREEIPGYLVWYRKIQLHRLANDKSQLRRKLPKVKDCIKSLSAKVISLNSIIKYGLLVFSPQITESSFHSK